MSEFAKIPEENDELQEIDPIDDQDISLHHTRKHSAGQTTNIEDRLHTSRNKTQKSSKYRHHHAKKRKLSDSEQLIRKKSSASKDLHRIESEQYSGMDSLCEIPLWTAFLIAMSIPIAGSIYWYNTYVIISRNIYYPKQLILINLYSSMSNAEYEQLHDFFTNCMRNSKSPHKYRELPYKSAQERFEEYQRILNLTYPYQKYPGHCWKNYCGPWQEELWIKNYCCDKNLDTFGPFIPLFVPWVNMYRAERGITYLEHINNSIFKHLKKDFLYMTVSQHDYGIEGIEKPNLDVPPNIFIFSGCGRGHVPTLLHTGDLQPVDPILPSQYRIIFIGSTHRKNRFRFLRTLHFYFQKDFLELPKTPDWQTAFRKSAMVMSPRGFARGCFRTAELLQLCLVPVLAFDNNPWVPYMNSSLPWDKIGFIIPNKASIPSVVEKIRNTTEEQLKQMRKEMRKYRDSHFTMNATIKQIMRFVRYGEKKSDLRCDTYYGNM